MASLKELLLMKQQASTIKEEEKIEEKIEEKKTLSLKELLQAKKEAPTIKEEEKEEEKKEETFSLSISLNQEQILAKELAFSGKSFCLTGAAGTGKTTAQREIAKALLEQNLLSSHNFRIQGSNGERWTGPSIAFVAYTRIASGNLKRAIHKDPTLEEILLHNVTTIHNLLEYSPETYWCYEEDKEKFRFVPRRTATNPLDLTHLIIEEASMVDLDLWDKLFSALKPDTQIIFIGDINQLQPVFGASIINYALVQLPVVELKTVYRQAGDSTILENAHNILAGKAVREAPDFRIIRGGDSQYSQHKMMMALAATFKKWQEVGEYDPLQDIILSPFNKQDLGTDSINNYIAQDLGVKRNATVFQVKAGIRTLYLAVGDKVLYNKRVGVISQISHNMEYHGASTLHPSPTLSRFGVYTSTIKDREEENEDDAFELDYSGIDLDKMLEEGEEGQEDKVRQASHVITLEMEDEEEATLSAVGDFSSQSFSLGYALTVHKAQGCEWRHVFLILHKDHSIMAHRELLYTAVTRASKKVYLIAKDYMITKAITTQRVKGNTLAEKIEIFNAKISLDAQVRCYK